MFIYATGRVNGKDYDEKPVNVKEVIKHFNLPFDGTTDAEFTLVDSLVKYDELNKVWRHRQNAYKPARIVVTKNNESVELRFCEAPPTKDRKNGNNVYSPEHMIYPGRDFFIPRTDLEQQVFFYLHPACEQSPAKNGSPAEWNFIDRKADAKKETEAFEIVMKIAAEISNEQDFTRLKRSAKGIKFIINGETKSIPHGKINDDEVKAQLLKLATAHPTEFAVAYRDANLFLEGCIVDAIDSGLLIHEGVGGGMSQWRWTIGDKSVFGSTITNGTDPRAALINTVHSDRWGQVFTEMLETNSNYRFEPKPVAQKEFKDMSGRELAAVALSSGLTEYNREKKVYQLIVDFEPAPQSLLKIEDPTKRVWELEVALGERGICRNRVVKALNGEEVKNEE